MHAYDGLDLTTVVSVIPLYSTLTRAPNRPSMRIYCCVYASRWLSIHDGLLRPRTSTLPSQYFGKCPADSGQSLGRVNANLRELRYCYLRGP